MYNRLGRCKSEPHIAGEQEFIIPIWGPHPAQNDRQTKSRSWKQAIGRPWEDYPSVLYIKKLAKTWWFMIVGCRDFAARWCRASDFKNLYMSSCKMFAQRSSLPKESVECNVSQTIAQTRMWRAIPTKNKTSSHKARIKKCLCEMVIFC